MIGNLSLLHTVWLSIVNSSNTGIDPDLHVVITVIAGALVHNDAEQPMGMILTLGLLTFKISCYHLWFQIHVLWSGDIILHDLVECIAILIVHSLTNTWYQSIPLHIKIPNINSKGVSNELSIHFEVNECVHGFFLNDALMEVLYNTWKHIPWALSKVEVIFFLNTPLCKKKWTLMFGYTVDESIYG